MRAAPRALLLPWPLPLAADAVRDSVGLEARARARWGALVLLCVLVPAR